jgi:hypothetical protein
MFVQCLSNVGAEPGRRRSRLFFFDSRSRSALAAWNDYRCCKQDRILAQPLWLEQDNSYTHPSFFLLTYFGQSCVLNAGAFISCTHSPRPLLCAK